MGTLFLRCGFYAGFSVRATNRGTMIVTTVRDEGPNILEWVAYHRLIGFDNIIVFQNGSFDTTEKTLKVLHRMGVVRYYENNYRRPGRTGYQNKAYRRAARLPEYQSSEWCIALDGDEFLRVNIGKGRVQDLVSAVEDASEIRINWRIFGNSEQRHLNSRLVLDRFTMANEASLPSRRPVPVKTLFRTDQFRGPGIHTPRQFLGENRVVRVGSGARLEDVVSRGFQVTDPEPYKIAQINHYMVRDSDSFLMKSLVRGSSSHPERNIALSYWKKRNVNLQECLGLKDFSGQVRAEMKRLDLDSGGILLRLRTRSLRMWSKRIAELKATPEGEQLWNSLV